MLRIIHDPKDSWLPYKTQRQINILGFKFWWTISEHISEYTAHYFLPSTPKPIRVVWEES